MQVIDFAPDPVCNDVGHVLLGTVSARLDPETWAAFEGFRAANPWLSEPLDTWGKERTRALIERTGLIAHFPDSQPPFPLVSKAVEVFPSLFQSPLGMLVSTEFGLLFGIRAWVQGERGAVEALAKGLGWFERATTSPCDLCSDKPCLTSCPVGAFGSPQGGEGYDTYDYEACVAQLWAQRPTGACWQGGCLARAACPLSTAYSQAQAAFHHTKALDG